MSSTSYLIEPEKQLPVAGNFDVIVAGAGPAGIAAAIAAARNGARTLLIEHHGCLGGVWTAGVLSWVIDSGNKNGIMHEIITELDARGARAAKGRHFAFDVEQMKLLLEDLCLECGVTIRLHTRVTSAIKSGRRLQAVVTESRSGREAFRAKVFIDTTGDGDLAARAGCRFDYGHPKLSSAQPMSLVGLLAGIHSKEIAPFVGGGVAEAKVNLLEEFKRAGVTPSYSAPTLFPIRENFFALVANHEYGVSPMVAEEVTAATLNARREIVKLTQALRAMGGAWSGLHLVATGAQIGIREGRRIRGLYSVRAEDLFEGKRHTDGICRVTAGIDVHSIDPAASTAYNYEHRRRSQPYDVPLRALIAADVEGLMMAGRCISGDFWAHSSYRMTGNAVAMGEAAGVTAAIAAAMDCLPQECPWAEISSRLSSFAAC